MKLFEELENKYLNNSIFINILAENKVEYLTGFLEDKENVYRFYNKFYSLGYPKIVLCGINPGKNGAGKTGIPFIDYKSLSKIFEDIKRCDSERSAKYVFKLIEYIGIEKFFRNIYLTNFSFLGFTKNKKNINYYELPPKAVDIIHENFIYEMNIVNPDFIISLSKDVYDHINSIFSGTNINIKYRLPHPNYCSFPSREGIYLDQYLALLKNIIITI